LKKKSYNWNKIDYAALRKKHPKCIKYHSCTKNTRTWTKTRQYHVKHLLLNDIYT
jgi:hypothetical protein